MFRTVTVKFSGAPRSLGSSEKEYWVLAMQTGVLAKALLGELLGLLLGVGGEDHVLAAVDLGDDGPQLVLDGGVQLVSLVEVVGLLAQAHHFLGQGLAALAAFAPDLGQGHVHAQSLALLLDEGQLRLGIQGEAVDGDHTGQAEDGA